MCTLNPDTHTRTHTYIHTRSEIKCVKYMKGFGEEGLGGGGESWTEIDWLIRKKKVKNAHVSLPLTHKHTHIFNP